MNTAEQVNFANQRAYALRQMADLIEANPDLAGSRFSYVELYNFPEDPGQMLRLVRLLGGARTKDSGDHWLTVRREFGAGVQLTISGDREQMCEAVVVGTERVEIADPAAPMITVDRDVIEWRCAPILANAVGA